VRGLDLARPLPSATVASLTDAFDTHHLLLFRAQQLSPARQVEIAELFGPAKLANGEPVSFVSNV
jgi:alpha-ketoglutarate-dependent taurine dioxygenase